MASHAAGAALGIVVTVLCVVRAAFHHSGIGVVGGADFRCNHDSALFYFQCLPRTQPSGNGKKVLRVLDHCTIYLLIAGTYTPLALSALRPAHPALGWTIFGVVWGAAAIGILLTAIDMERFKVFSMIRYLAMGWCIVVAMKPTVLVLGTGGTVFLILGGVAYTIGAILYGVGKKKRYIHSVFHLFVVAGSLMHFFCILFYVL